MVSTFAVRRFVSQQADNHMKPEEQALLSQAFRWMSNTNKEKHIVLAGRDDEVLHGTMDLHGNQRTSACSPVTCFPVN